ncbi:ubiquitin-conjugating enzyme E2 J1 [Synchiropus splendidus]|uniref:ubiquitin-conjugating enzyme E2 J1 n=1 Tax=Synchiropus splendidus TaxID=270530 RepID=UPI00237D3B48|nr:ubiquitin-conjugating enzyme E2 J1 [Synchiropus splendidus]XP_053743110.1 ubiquitin-conjugating enzyme E2 J1 [Synchiropus splendidus]XP_053743111.1 ubiquitin-conjugating enzyme E2 J1 [Synchiropus splendidus]
MENKYNLKSPAVKRLMKEAAELRDPTEHYHAQPLEDNLFEWHFSVRGPPDSDFDGGVYHGRIVLPPEYPMKPPSIILLTPNGRFEVGKKICLSISGHHPETWQPSWSIRTALIAIIGFMPTKGEGAIGSLDYTPEERRALAKKSQDFCCEACDCSMRTALLPLTPNSNPRPEDHQAKKLALQINFKAVPSRRSSESAAAGASSHPPSGSKEDTSAGQQAAGGLSQDQAPGVQAVPAEETQPATPANPSRPLSPRQRRAQQQNQRENREAASRPEVMARARPRQHQSHAGSAVLIVVLTIALAALIFRRIYLSNEYKFDYEL